MASQSVTPSSTPTVTVNGTSSGGLGTYGIDTPTVIVTGDPGDTVRVTLTKGFDPVTNTASGIDGLVEDRLNRYDFKVSNTFDSQTVDVVIGANGAADLSDQFLYTTSPSNNKGSFAGDDVAPLGFVASVIDPGNGNLPISTVSAPVYLDNVGGPVGSDPVPEPEGYFEIIGSGHSQYFKIQIEDENGTGGTNPGGKWSYETSGEENGFQDGFQGDGYYLFGDPANGSIDNGVGANELLEYTIFVPEDAVGTFTFNFAVSRDNPPTGDAQNDLWLNFQAQIEISEAGYYTVQVDGRSQGYHVDYFELFKGSKPPNGASNSVFKTDDPTDGGGPVDPEPTDGTLVFEVDASSDDWEQFGGGGSNDLEFGLNGGNAQTVGIRFDDITIPDGANIVDAYLSFEAFESNATTSNFTIEIQDSENAATYSTGSNPNSRSYAVDDLEWNDVEVWTTGQNYRTLDITTLIQSVIGADGIDNGALAFRISGVGERAANSFDASGAAPELVIVLNDDGIA